MKKWKVIPLESEQMDLKDYRAIDEINRGLEQIDQFPVYTPDIQWFEQMITVQKQVSMKKLVKDFTVFILIALFILSGIIVSLYHNPFIFIVLQIPVIVFIASYTGMRFVKKVNEA
ncbi:MAG: YxlC family protein [Bacillota bacterium]|nr:YxlC family protein [Bacillota bacterium]